MNTNELLNLIKSLIKNGNEQLICKINTIQKNILNVSFDDFEANIASINSELSKYSQMSKFKPQTLEKVEQVLEKLEEIIKYSEIKNVIVQADKISDNVQDKIVQINKNLESVVAEKASVEKNLNELKNNVAGLTAGNQQQKKSLENLTTENTNLKESIIDKNNRIDDVNKDLTSIETNMNDLNNELKTLIPSLKAGKLTEKFTTEAVNYKTSSYWFLGITIGLILVIALFGYYSIEHIADNLKSGVSTKFIIIESIVRSMAIFFGVYAVTLLTGVFNRSRNLMEEYLHKAAIGDYYVAMKIYVESILEKDINEDERSQYLEYLLELSKQFTEEISVAPRDIHLTNTAKVAKLRAKLETMGVKADISKEEQHTSPAK